ncbi:MAG: hypothetical protein M5U01_33510 [Ardenticatenaceae bacterium]|nr:hypothetical protein [Ardenticatenaceae bacterium]HBY96825.1 hypothetical protein [Chloroflexota bacterium]
MARPRKLDLIVHATHEAGLKVGGIGAVLDGLLSSENYNKNVKRTILVGPFNLDDAVEMERLEAPRNRFRVRYSSLGGKREVKSEMARALDAVALYYHVPILYGTRAFGSAEHEVLLIDARNVTINDVNAYKQYLWDRFQIQSDRYEGQPEFDTFIAAAEPSFAALQVIVGEGPAPTPPATALLEPGLNYLIAHEWLGLPLLFSAERRQPGAYRTIFYAHEVATVRPLVEEHPGHDTRFYNAMRAARASGLYLDDVFGNQSGFFKHALIRAGATTAAGLFAVGDLVVDELRFLDPAVAGREIDLVYNGVPSWEITLYEKRASKRLLQQYCQNMLGYEPTWVFTHVTRLIPSKGLWRDIRVLEHLDYALANRGETAVLYTLSSVIPAGRRVEDVLRWEAQYGWPVIHRADNGDLVATELDYYHMIEAFNHEARACRVVLINQFGFSPDRLGTRLPAGTEFMDIRKGSDLEFGQSIYEPFGIAQVEPLSFGALCVVSNSCGCVGFIERSGGLLLPNVVVADYLTLPAVLVYYDLAGLLSIGRAERDIVEAQAAAEVTSKVLERFPRDTESAKRLLTEGYGLSQRMSWEVVAREYLLPALRRLDG